MISPTSGVFDYTRLNGIKKGEGSHETQDGSKSNMGLVFVSVIIQLVFAWTGPL